MSEMTCGAGDLIKGGSVVISAGAGGAGRVIAREFAARGAKVAICDVDSAAVAAFNDEYPDIVSVVTDAGSEQAVDEFFDLVERRNGAVSVVINNVGIAGPTAPVEQLTLEDWEQSIRTNLTSHFLFARRAVPSMKARGAGLIINVSSGSAKTGLPLRLPYVVTKSAVISMAMNMARELGPHGIRVNAILPGAIRGERIEKVIAVKAAALGVAVEDYQKTLLRYVSLRTMVEPEDIAAMALFLASGAGAKITGQTIGVDGNIEYEE